MRVRANACVRVGIRMFEVIPRMQKKCRCTSIVYVYKHMYTNGCFLKNVPENGLT